MITRYSSRRTQLAGFLPQQLQGACHYDRIAGFFTSSVLEIAGEELERLAWDGGESCVRVICNSRLDPLDVETARAAKFAMWREWCESLPPYLSDAMKSRLVRLFEFLSSGRMKVKVLPDSRFGLIHGKAGVITHTNGSSISFLGSVNESKTAWALNYELIWTDDSPEAVTWVQEEFDALWSSPQAVELSEAVIEDIERLTRRTIISGVDIWKKQEEAFEAIPIVELPVYRRENGLWAHQKYFVKLAFAAHQQGGARYLLADQVGLGKTVQLALAAKLMALYGDKPVLILVPKPLQLQWQGELWDLLEMPSAIWDKNQWVDEQGISHGISGPEGFRHCPRRVGIVSTGLISSGSEISQQLLSQKYECIILDEAHRARRRNLGATHVGETAEPNNLLSFLQHIAPQTKSLLFGTATPVQLSPIEAWDLLDALNSGNDTVLGSRFSRWRVAPWEGLDLILGRQIAPDDAVVAWQWICNPLPPAVEGIEFDIVRRGLRVRDDEHAIDPGSFQALRPSDQQRVKRMLPDFFGEHNPFIRHIVRRTREFLEETIDPQTNEPYLQPVRVRLFGEGDDEAIALPPFLQDAYHAAELFCTLLEQRPHFRSGFLKTLLLRRVGSSIEAGQHTAAKMLGLPLDADEVEDEEEIETPPVTQQGNSVLYPLSREETKALQAFLDILRINRDEDPKLYKVLQILLEGLTNTGPWLNAGCIIFSQYYDSVIWLARKLSMQLPDETIAIYASASKSGLMQNGVFVRVNREDIKQKVRRGELKLVTGTDAASEGLNLQRLGTLINLDLPWNPTRLEQRKGRIQRIGQIRDEVLVYNMRYKGSVEDRVHELLSSRLANIMDMFGQVPDTLEDVWVLAALHQEEQARQVIDAVPEKHPFEMRYDRIEAVDWESCSRVLDSMSQIEVLQKGWS